MAGDQDTWLIETTVRALKRGGASMDEVTDYQLLTAINWVSDQSWSAWLLEELVDGSASLVFEGGGLVYHFGDEGDLRGARMLLTKARRPRMKNRTRITQPDVPPHE